MSNIKTNTSEFYEFMKKYKVGPGQKMSHTFMGKPYGRYNIRNNKQTTKKFFNLYNKALEENANLYLIEVHKEYGPIIIDIDMLQQEKSRLYNLETIKLVLETYIKYINKYIDTSNLDYNIYVTEKDNPSSKNDNYKDGFHIIIPDICIKTEIKYLIRQEVVNEFNKNKYFKKLKILNNNEDIFDKAVIEQTGWLVYGSTKPDKKPYLLTHVYNQDLEEQDITNINKYDLPQILSIRNNDEDDILETNFSADKIKEKLKEFNIQKKPKKKGIRRKRQLNLEDIEELRGAISEDKNGNEVREEGLLDMLDPARADNFEDWRDLGFALHNIDEYELLEDWIEFSSQSSKFDNTGNDCEKRWDNFKSNDFTIGTIKYWAKMDNPTKYREWSNKQERKYIQAGISGFTADVAETIFKLKRDQYKCASIKNSTWYEFKDNTWKNIDCGYPIINYMNNELSKKFKKQAEEYDKISESKEEKDKEDYEEKIEAALKVAKNLLDSTFKKKIMEELTYKFYDDKFYEKLDENKDLIAFNNGVYDFNKLEFRHGLPEDYISLSTNINYMEYNENNDQILQVENFFSEIQPEGEMKDYVLNFFSECLQGHQQTEQFNIWTGCGANGKSLAIQLFQEALGDYSTNISITLLTNKRASSNAASPELAKCKGVRFVVFQEPENDDKIHVGHMKELTGGDKISARRLYKEPVDFYPQFKTLLTCNKLPYIPSNDGGTWRRLKVVPFEIEFVDNPKEEHQRKRDNSLKQHIGNWKEPLLSILIHRFKKIHYKKINKLPLDEPVKVKQFTLEYQKNSDIYLEFIKDTIIKTDDSEDKIYDTELYKLFKTWFKESQTDPKIPNRNEFKLNIEEKLKCYKNLGGGRGWEGYKLIDNNIDIDI